MKTKGRKEERDRERDERKGEKEEIQDEEKVSMPRDEAL